MCVLIFFFSIDTPIHNQMENIIPYGVSLEKFQIYTTCKVPRPCMTRPRGWQICVWLSLRLYRLGLGYLPKYWSNAGCQPNIGKIRLSVSVLVTSIGISWTHIGPTLFVILCINCLVLLKHFIFKLFRLGFNFSNLTNIHP